MREHHLSVTTLEEYEPNPEFVGRNFNAGEIIQLVLKARSGHWLPFNYVQMVMMHELAHCVQMNHSRAFWKVRNSYAEQMRQLWSRGYSGEGLWGRGAHLATGRFEINAVTGGEELPEHLCGGTYRSRRRGRRKKKRGRKGGEGEEELSYQERKQRRIENKFGKNGVALGADEDVKVKLEKGKKTKAKPRVAGSNRGRELRAAAALARFEQQHKEEIKTEDDEDDDDDENDSGSDYEDAEDMDAEAIDAVDIDGKKLLDTRGNHMVRVCGDENSDDQDAANELRELQTSITRFFPRAESKDDIDAKDVVSVQAVRRTSTMASTEKSQNETKEIGTSGQDRRFSYIKIEQEKDEDGDDDGGDGGSQSRGLEIPPRVSTTSDEANTTKAAGHADSCVICSFTNEANTMTCHMCSHVLDPTSVPGTWSCLSTTCKGSKYLNAGDCGTCGVCGQRKKTVID